MGEQYSYLFTEHYGLSTINLRLFNVFGKRHSSGSCYSGVISTFISAIQQGLPINIYGDGTQTRDFIYIEDVVTAFVQALTISLNKYSYFTCNVGSGQRTSLLELLEILQNYFPDKKICINFLEPQLGDIKHSWANITKAEEILFLNLIQIWFIT
ncbi:MAG: UDP-N-acetylglucosamine 4-epimerase [Chroococcopsis gigantea SAG 12.99]|nr:UDP-N-acetylglucosamine 4-epimerase [Chroococcopsis gigantea SAG 12.99]